MNEIVRKIGSLAVGDTPLIYLESTISMLRLRGITLQEVLKTDQLIL